MGADSSGYPRYQIIKVIANSEPRNLKTEFGIMETIMTWSGPRTYIRQLGFKTEQDAADELWKRKGIILEYM